jgi:hypothetical protein
VYIIPKNYPELNNSPVEYVSPIGYVNSTPKSNATAIIGTILNPYRKHNSVVSQTYP